jgi:hypothetical protein
MPANRETAFHSLSTDVSVRNPSYLSVIQLIYGTQLYRSAGLYRPLHRRVYKILDS